ncbi:MAG: hypothetical protein K8R40_05720 [Anaerolineaceae bacterium]|nr:hypothetical protein [Anaerolineaceae bacterium]
MTRLEFLNQITEKIISAPCAHPLRVAFDGVDAAGKTIFADELASLIESCSRTVIRSSVDYFHHPAVVRHQRSSSSPESYYDDSYNYDELIRMLLKPLGATAGGRRYCAGIYDYRVEQALEEVWQVAPSDAILLFDGIFLQRPELFDYWDLRIFLQIDFETSVARAAQRDQYLFGTEAQTRERYLKRYVPGQRIYLESVHPAEKADILIDHRDPQNPRMLR